MTHTNINTFSERNHTTLQNQSRWTASNTKFPWKYCAGEPYKCAFIPFTFAVSLSLAFSTSNKKQISEMNQKSHFKTLFFLNPKRQTSLFLIKNFSKEFSKITFSLNRSLFTPIAVMLSSSDSSNWCVFRFL